MSRQVKKVNISGKEDKSNKVSSWSNTTTDIHYPSEKLVKDSLDGKANSTHTHSQYLTEHQDLSNYVTTDDSRLSDARTPTSHTHTQSQITDFPTLPTASSTVPSADTQSGSYGSGTSYARSNHTHPKSSLYAESSHTHSQYLTEHQSLANYVQKSSTSGLLKNDGSVDTTQYLSSLPSHNHDDRYYTESEVDTALNGKANSSHTHTKSQITDFPTIPSKTSDLTNDSGFLTFEDGAIYVEGSNATTETTTNTFKATLPLSASDIVDGLKLVYKVSVTSTNSTSDLRLQLGLSNQTNESYIKANNTSTTANLYPRSTLLFLVRCNGGWHIVGTSTLENSNNKVTSWGSTTTDAHYPSEKLVKDSLDGKSDNGHTHSQYLTSHQDITGKEDSSNKVSSWSSTTNNIRYPTEKLVKDSLDGKADNNHTHEVLLSSNDDSDIQLFNVSAQGIPQGEGQSLGAFLLEFWKKIYPIGSIYMNVNNVDPAILFGGQWEQIEDMFLLASGSTYENGTTGGSADATLVSHNHTTRETGEYFVTSENSDSNNTKVSYSASGNRYVDGMTASSTPFHHRTATGYEGSSATGKNMPPYLAVNVWKRTA